MKKTAEVVPTESPLYVNTGWSVNITTVQNMKKHIPIKLLTILACIATFANCERRLQYSGAQEIVQTQFGGERFEKGKYKWCFHEVLGAEGPYTTDVNGDFQGSGFSMSFGQPGMFSVASDSGTIEKRYGGVEGVAFMAIPVQNQQLKNAVIVCRTCPVEN